MWSVFIVKFLISVRSLNGFSPFLPPSSEIPWRRMGAVGDPASHCFTRHAPLLYPCSPWSKITGKQPEFLRLCWFFYLSSHSYRYSAHVCLGNSHCSLSFLGAFWDLVSPPCCLLLLQPCKHRHPWAWAIGAQPVGRCAQVKVHNRHCWPLTHAHRKAHPLHGCVGKFCWGERMQHSWNLCCHWCFKSLWPASLNLKWGGLWCSTLGLMLPPLPLESSSDELEGERYSPLCRCSGAQVTSLIFPHDCGISFPLPRRHAGIQCTNLAISVHDRAGPRSPWWQLVAMMCCIHHLCSLFYSVSGVMWELCCSLPSDLSVEWSWRAVLDLPENMIGLVVEDCAGWG